MLLGGNVLTHLLIRRDELFGLITGIAVDNLRDYRVPVNGSSENSRAIKGSVYLVGRIFRTCSNFVSGSPIAYNRANRECYLYSVLLKILWSVSSSLI